LLFVLALRNIIQRNDRLLCTQKINGYIYGYPGQPCAERFFKAFTIIIAAKCVYFIKCPHETFVRQLFGVILVLYIPYGDGSHITIAIFVYKFFASFISFLGTTSHCAFQRQRMLSL